MVRPALLALMLCWGVAVLSQGAPLFANLREGMGDTRDLLIIVAWVALGTGIATGVAWKVCQAAGRSRRWHVGSPEQLVPFAAVAFSALALLAIARAPLDRVPGPSTVVELEGREGQRLVIIDDREGLLAGAAQTDDGSVAGPQRDLPARPLIIALGVIGALLGAGWLARLLRRPPSVGEEPAVADSDTVQQLVIDTIEAMLNDPDPRTAIIGAYARLLEGFDLCGVPRREYEGPVEHIVRALHALNVRAGPIRDLTNLFEIARFSDHPLAAEHRDRALNALRAAAGDLAARASPAEPQSPWAVTVRG